MIITKIQAYDDIVFFLSLLTLLFIVFGIVKFVYCQNDPTTLVYPEFDHSLGIGKATGWHLKFVAGNTIKFNDPQGIAAVKLVHLDDPATEDDDAKLTVYGVNCGAHQIVYNTSLYSLASFGEYGTEDGQFRYPRGITADVLGNVYVVDTGNDRVVKLRYVNSTLRFVKNIGRYGSQPAEFNKPRQIALDTKGNLYVTDTGNHRIQVLDSNGNFLYSFGEYGKKDGQLDSPDGIAVIDHNERWSSYHDEFLCVIDLHHTRIQMFDLFGRFITAIEGKDIGRSLVLFAYLAIDYYSNVYVTDSINHQIHKFDRHLNYITSFGKKGYAAKEFDSPRGIAIWRRYGQVFVLDRRSVQYFWVGVDIFQPAVFPQMFTSHPDSMGTTIVYYLTEPAWVSITILDYKYKVIRNLISEYCQPTGVHLVVWNGINDSGKPVVPGIYIVRITAEPTYSSRTHFQKNIELVVKCAPGN